jgi:hypothetical protein
MGQVFTMWDHMRHYPGLLGLYVVGTGAVAGGNLGALSYALRDLRFGDEFMDSTRTAIDPAAFQLLPAARPTATSAWMEQHLSGVAEGLVASEQLVAAFDQFEYSIDLLLADRALGPDLDGSLYIRPAGWWYRQKSAAPWSQPDGSVTGPQGEEWLDAGFFAGSPERLVEVRKRYDEHIAQERMRARSRFWIATLTSAVAPTAPRRGGFRMFGWFHEGTPANARAQRVVFSCLQGR